MNRSAFVLGLAVLAVGTSLVHADPVDPVYTMDDPLTGTPVGTNFLFTSDQAGGGVFAFLNASGVLWNDLTISATELNGTPITVLPGLFFNSFQFSSTPVSATMTKFTIGLFNTGNSLGGIGIGAFFTINLNDLIGDTKNLAPDGAGGWGPSASFSAAANALPGDPNNNAVTPEPASMLLLSLGLGLVWCGSGRLRRSRL